MIGKEDIQKLAELSRIELAPGEAESLTKDIEAIVAYVSQVEGETAEPHAGEKQSLRNVMRNDGPPHEAGAHTADIVAEAPKVEDGYIAVKPILSRD